jgi:hypothetical protein
MVRSADVIPGSTAVPWRMVGVIAAIAAGAGGAAWAVQRARRSRTPGRDAGVAAAAAGGSLTAWETAWWLARRARRTRVFRLAQADAAALARPLVVVGAPDGGVTAGYGCGDFTIDLSPTVCPRALAMDITRGPLPFGDDSVVVFCCCVLEYVTDPCAAIAELRRIGGAHTYFVGVEPWTLTALLYPGARQTLPAQFR